MKNRTNRIIALAGILTIQVLSLLLIIYVNAAMGLAISTIGTSIFGGILFYYIIKGDNE